MHDYAIRHLENAVICNQQAAAHYKARGQLDEYADMLIAISDMQHSIDTLKAHKKKASHED